ncbi:hypothetical protein [Saccharibacillus sacchari]|uniref:Uncharacterized protein n=1 Tax=Saccharibacillus sacchari TaxID=456493 RepID=A0ACC6P9Y5_9BACL
MALFDRKTRGWMQAATPALSSQDPEPEAEHFVVPVRLRPGAGGGALRGSCPARFPFGEPFLLAAQGQDQELVRLLLQAGRL